MGRFAVALVAVAALLAGAWWAFGGADDSAAVPEGAKNGGQPPGDGVAAGGAARQPRDPVAATGETKAPSMATAADSEIAQPDGGAPEIAEVDAAKVAPDVVSLRAYLAEAASRELLAVLESGNAEQLQPYLDMLAEIEKSVAAGESVGRERLKSIARAPWGFSHAAMDTIDRLVPLVTVERGELTWRGIDAGVLKALVDAAAQGGEDFIERRVLARLVTRWSPEEWGRNGNFARYQERVAREPDAVPANWCMGPRDTVYCSVLVAACVAEEAWTPRMRLLVREIATDESEAGDARRIASSVWISQVMECAILALGNASVRFYDQRAIEKSTVLLNLEMDGVTKHQFFRSLWSEPNDDRFAQQVQDLEKHGLLEEYMEQWDAFVAGESPDYDIEYYRPPVVRRPWPKRLHLQTDRLHRCRRLDGVGYGGGGLRYLRSNPITGVILSDETLDTDLYTRYSRMAESSGRESAMRDALWVLTDYFKASKADLERLLAIRDLVTSRFLADEGGTWLAELRIRIINEINDTHALTRLNGEVFRNGESVHGSLGKIDGYDLRVLVERLLAHPERYQDHSRRASIAARLVTYANAEAPDVLATLTLLLRRGHELWAELHRGEIMDAVLESASRRFRSKADPAKQLVQHGELVAEIVERIVVYASDPNLRPTGQSLRLVCNGVLYNLQKLATIVDGGRDTVQLESSRKLVGVMRWMCGHSAMPPSETPDSVGDSLESSVPEFRLRLLLAGWDV